MHTATPTRNTHLRKDLEALIAWLAATSKADSLHDKIDRSVPVSHSAMAEALIATLEADKTWHQIPKKRRLRAENLHKIAIKAAESALELGGVYSGKTTKEIIWEGPAFASTSRSSGDSYSRNKWQCRTDANHEIHLDFDGLLAMELNAALLEQSAEEGLPVIALYREKRRPHVYQAIWAQKGAGKGITSVDGWIAHDPARSLMCHSTISASDATKGLIKKTNVTLEEHRHQEALREASPRQERRARLIAKICGNIHATIGDAQKLGYCNAGITAFRQLHGIGDTASLPMLLESGNPLAIKLALYLARRTAANKKSKANF